MTSYAQSHTFLCLHPQICIKTSIQSLHLKSEKKSELNELIELEYSKTLSQISHDASKHVFLYLHAQTNFDTLIY